MLTPDDIKNLTEYQVLLFKDIFATKEDIADIKSHLDLITNSIDAFSKDSERVSEEIITLSHRVSKAEKNIKTLADRAAVKLDY